MAYNPYALQGFAVSTGGYISFQEGSIIRDRATGAIYRVDGGRKSHFTADVYKLHGTPAYTDFDGHQLAVLPDGPMVLPPGIFEGQVIRDVANGAIYKVIGGKKCHYSNGQVYAAHGSPAFTNFDSVLVNAVTSGNAIAHSIVEGSVIRDPKTGAISRIINGKKSAYPNIHVYAAHGSPAYTEYDASVLNAIPTDISVILPPGFTDGQIIRNQNSGAIYRIVHGRKCHFPNPESYAAHGSPAFTNFEPSRIDMIPDGFAL